MASFQETLRTRAIAKIRDAVEHERNKMDGGKLSYEDYKRISGVIEGLRKAVELIETSEKELLNR